MQKQYSAVFHNSQRDSNERRKRDFYCIPSYELVTSFILLLSVDYRDKSNAQLVIVNWKRQQKRTTQNDEFRFMDHPMNEMPRRHHQTSDNRS